MAAAVVTKREASAAAAAAAAGEVTKKVATTAAAVAATTGIINLFNQYIFVKILSETIGKDFLFMSSPRLTGLYAPPDGPLTFSDAVDLPSC